MEYASNGSQRMILNLKNFNKFVCFRHFEMESIITSSKVPKFFSKLVSLFHMHAKWVLSCHENLYKDHESTDSVLRKQGHTSVVYVDDSYLDSYGSCLNNVNDTMAMLESLGFNIYPEKSVLKPTQNLIYLDFIINSKDMTLKLKEEKK